MAQHCYVIFKMELSLKVNSSIYRYKELEGLDAQVGVIEKLNILEELGVDLLLCFSRKEPAEVVLTSN